jgi:murein DD-endopeptidase MepM/ murein hydrolase activator NlpD
LALTISVTVISNRSKKNEKLPKPIDSSTNVDSESEEPEESEDREEPEDSDTQAPQPSQKPNEKPSTNVENKLPSFVLPVNGVLSKKHDTEVQVYSTTMNDYRVHIGLDLVTAEDAPVYAAADGEVAKAWDDPLMGRCVAVSHGDDIFTYYKNLDATLCESITQGAKLKGGDQIGKVGETAILELADEPHLHLEMTVGGLAVDPRDYFSDAATEVLKSDTSYESSAVGEEVTEDINTGK